jgi:hypothetical protein
MSAQNNEKTLVTAMEAGLALSDLSYFGIHKGILHMSTLMDPRTALCGVKIPAGVPKHLLPSDAKTEPCSICLGRHKLRIMRLLFIAPNRQGQLLEDIAQEVLDMEL